MSSPRAISVWLGVIEGLASAWLKKFTNLFGDLNFIQTTIDRELANFIVSFMIAHSIYFDEALTTRDYMSCVLILIAFIISYE